MIDIETVQADINEFGAFTFDVHVPNVVDYNVHTVNHNIIMFVSLFLQFNWNNNNNNNKSKVMITSGYTSGSVAVNIADPRIPTGQTSIN